MYGDNYGYGYNPYGFANVAGNAGILILIAFIAAIVLTVIGYKRYIKVPGQTLINFKDKSTWGPFLRFDTLLIERILKMLYLFAAVSIPLYCLAIALAAFSAGFGAGLAALIGMALVALVAEIVTRLIYEGIMLNVIVARNTSDIKRALGVGDAMDADGISSPSPVDPAVFAAQEQAVTYDVAAQAAPSQPVSAVPEAVQVTPVVAAPVATPAPTVAESAPVATPAPAVAESAPVEEAAPSQEKKPATKKKSNSKSKKTETNTCPNCGTELKDGAQFCSNCGTKLE